MIPNFFGNIEEELLHIPNTKLSLTLRVRADNDKTQLFTVRNTLDNRKNLTLNSSDYLMFRHFESRELNETIFISYLNFTTLLKGFREFLKIFRESFVYDDDDSPAIVTSKAVYYKISNLTGNKTIGLIPLLDESNLPACALYLNGEAFMSIISYDDYIHLLNFLEKFDLYTASKALLNTAMLYHAIGMSRESAPVLKRRTYSSTPKDPLNEQS